MGITSQFNTYISLTPSTAGGLGFATKDGPGDPDGSTIYTVTSINFHVPAEHLIANVRHDMEVQIFHTSSTGSTLILSVLFNETTNSDDLRIFFTDFLTANSSATSTSNQINPVDVTGGYYYLRQFYNYNGTTTIPDCASAEWIIFDTPLNIVDTQFQNFASFLMSRTAGNYRSVQSNSNQVIHYYGDYGYAAYLLLGLGYLLV